MTADRKPTILSILTALGLAAYLIFAPLFALLAESWVPIWFGACLYLALILIASAVLATVQRDTSEKPPTPLVDRDALLRHVAQEQRERAQQERHNA